MVSAETRVTGVSGLPTKLCSAHKCTSEVTFQFSFIECMASAQLLRVCSQFCFHNACYLIYFLLGFFFLWGVCLFLWSFFFLVVCLGLFVCSLFFCILLLTLIGKVFLVKQWSKTQPCGVVFLQDFMCLSMILSPSMYYDNSYVKLSQKFKVFLIFSGNTVSWGTAV